MKVIMVVFFKKCEKDNTRDENILEEILKSKCGAFYIKIFLNVKKLLKRRNRRFSDIFLKKPVLKKIKKA